MSIKIRSSLLSDINTIVDFQLKMAWETENMKLDPLIVHKGVHAVFDNPAKGQYWIAELNEEIAGCLLTMPEWSDWRNGTVLWIHSVYVKEAARKLGVFTHLYRHLREKVEVSPDLRGLRLYVDKTNIQAQKIYKSLGMSGEHYNLFEWLK